MATVRMKKGVYFADIYDSPETIRQAQLDGYSLVEEKKEVKPAKVEAEVNLYTEEKNEEVVEDTISKSVHKKYKK